jgi:para-nitrobenzyl esterase
MRGRKEEPFYFFRVPYGKPPIGKRRFLPPEPIPYKRQKACEVAYGPMAPQNKGVGVLSNGSGNMSEDCLYLHITTPAIQGLHPVLVWIHGGAFLRGKAEGGLDPLVYVRSGIVVVSITYRLGILGFLDISEKFGEAYASSGNNGLLDIRLALQWIHQHIQEYGGDPSRVTVMGQSAGAKLAAALTIMEGTEGLFQKVICCSGALQTMRSRQTAQIVGRRILRKAEKAGLTGRRILTAPWTEILSVQNSICQGMDLHTFGPVMDGRCFRIQEPLSLLKEKARNFAFLLGTNRDEIELYWHVYRMHQMNEAMAARLFGVYAPLMLKEAQKIKPGVSYHRRFIQFMTECIYGKGTRDMAEAAAAGGGRVYLYRLDWDKQAWGACHASEGQFLNGSSYIIKDMNHSVEQARLGAYMRQCFSNFIKNKRSGRMTGGGWVPFETGTRRVMVLDAPYRMESILLCHSESPLPSEIFRLYTENT